MPAPECGPECSHSSKYLVARAGNPVPSPTPGSPVRTRPASQLHPLQGFHSLLDPALKPLQDLDRGELGAGHGRQSISFAVQAKLFSFWRVRFWYGHFQLIHIDHPHQSSSASQLFV